MYMEILTRPFAVAILILASFCAGAANAATFNLIYDGSSDQMIDTNNIVGTGTFSFDGPVTVGTFALSSLTNVSFSASFITGEIFGTADILSDLNFAGIYVFNAGGGSIGLVFTGIGEIPSVSGSLDLQNTFLDFLSHEPTGDLSDPIGCCGGDGVVNKYFLRNGLSGDYQATVVPLPAAAWLMIGGLVSLFAFRRK